MIVLIVVGMVYVLRQPKLKWSGLARTATMLAGLLVFTISLANNSATQSKIEDFSLSAVASSGNPISKRVDLTVESLQAAADTWFIGKGFNRQMSNTGGFEGYPTLQQWGTHNLYLETLLDSGIIGLAFLIAILISVIRMGMALEKSPHPGSAGLGTGVYLMMIAAALSYAAGHGMVKAISPLGILWILAGAAARRVYEEKRIKRLFVAT
jgi:O-antigen ligase